MQKRYHLIAIGGAVMHNLAINLSEKGNKITGSDDEIYDPSHSRLLNKGLLPDKMGWDTTQITPDLDAIILGKHAKKDNPELIKALELGLPIYSFPEFVDLHTKATTRICVTGSHGKTTTTAMIMHVLKKLDFKFDYLVGAKLQGFETMVHLEGNDVLVVEGDEYPSSCLDNRAKMLHYKPTHAIVTGIAWDHVNIYNTEDDYIKIFDDFVDQLNENSICFYDETDSRLNQMMIYNKYKTNRESYIAFRTNKKQQVVFGGQLYQIGVFGDHNLKNMMAAFKVCQSIGIKPDQFLEAISDFTGASKRLEKIIENDGFVIYKDFAHAPSKSKATVEAIRNKFKNQKVRAILELHTFSSLNQSFLPQYKNSLDLADEAMVFYDEHALEMKGMPPLSKQIIIDAFGRTDLLVSNEKEHLETYISNSKKEGVDVLLVMSSGSLSGIKLEDINY